MTAGDEFIWGVATSAFQIEGQLHNDMTRWERQGGFKIDDRNPIIGLAADHWRRWREDFELLNALAVNSYRFSLEWSRIEPSPGRFDHNVLEKYRRMIARLLQMDIVPMVTLHHFTHPRWFHDIAPWTSPESVDRFMAYVELVTEHILQPVPLIITFNEPLVWLLAGYADGRFPPGHKNLDEVMRGLYNMLTAHRRAYDHIKDKFPDKQIGMANNFMVFKRARKNHPVDSELRRRIHFFYNLMIPEAFGTNRLHYFFPFLLAYDKKIDLDDRIDFWGINYYARLHVQFRLDFGRPFDLLFLHRSEEGKSDLGWEIYPKGLRRVCRWLRPTGKPLYVTENGVAAQDDATRVAFLEAHLRELEFALLEGYPLKGYYHWTLLDNYEWLYGKSARFGLVEVNYEDKLKRTMKPSGAYYRDYILKSNIDAALEARRT